MKYVYGQFYVVHEYGYSVMRIWFLAVKLRIIQFWWYFLTLIFFIVNTSCNDLNCFATIESLFLFRPFKQCFQIMRDNKDFWYGSLSQCWNSLGIVQFFTSIFLILWTKQWYSAKYLILLIQSVWNKYAFYIDSCFINFNILNFKKHILTLQNSTS